MRDKEAQDAYDNELQWAVYTILEAKAKRERKQAPANDQAFQRFMVKVLS